MISKKLMLLLTLAFAISSLVFGQTKSKFIITKQLIDFAAVDIVEIRNYSGLSDSIEPIRKRLTTDQTKVFVAKWNNAKPTGSCKYIILFWVDVVFKDGTKRTFKINGKNIKEINDYCYDLANTKYLRNLWDQIK